MARPVVTPSRAQIALIVVGAACVLLLIYLMAPPREEGSLETLNLSCFGIVSFRGWPRLRSAATWVAMATRG